MNYIRIHQYICVTPDPGFWSFGGFGSFWGFWSFSAPPLVPAGARELHGKSEPQPVGSPQGISTTARIGSFTELHWLRASRAFQHHRSC